MTIDEICLWNALRRKAMGHRFRRQHAYGNFIFDFFCPHARLAVELDGAYHNDVNDRVRDAACAAAGILTLPALDFGGGAGGGGRVKTDVNRLRPQPGCSRRRTRERTLTSTTEREIDHYRPIGTRRL